MESGSSHGKRVVLDNDTFIGLLGSAAKEGTDAAPDARTEHGELLALHVGIGDNASALFNVSSTPWTMR